MSKDIKVDIKQLERLRDNLQALDKDLNDFLEGCAKELAARLIATVIKRTPVATGTLRRAWSTNHIKVRHEGSSCVVEIINPTEYASYVEYGHRTANHTGWVPGQCMLTISEEEIRQSAPGILEQRIKKWLSGVVK